jgi:hypothetical protein
MAPQSAMLPVGTLRYRVEQYREKSAMLESSRCYDLNGVHFSKKLDRFIRISRNFKGMRNPKLYGKRKLHLV